MIEKTSNAILRAEAIFGELRATLNMDYEVSNELDTMYEYVLHRLSEANIQKAMKFSMKFLSLVLILETLGKKP